MGFVNNAMLKLRAFLIRFASANPYAAKNMYLLLQSVLSIIELKPIACKSQRFLKTNQTNN
jgi:hypothetical protein